MDDVRLFSTENIECEECCAELATEENISQLCAEPYNGTVVTCDCGCEYTLNMKVQIMKIG